MSKAIGIFFVLFGGLFLLSNLGVISAVGTDIVWPLLFVCFGLYMLMRHKSSAERAVDKQVEEETKRSV